MNKIEKLLAEEKAKLDNEKAPNELENRLRQALAQRKRKSYPQRKWLSISAVVLIFALFFGYSFDAMAYYGKKILGYDQVIVGSLKSLNNLGEGQRIDKEFTFSDGSSIHIDGIFFDDNQLQVLYTEKLSKNAILNKANPDTFLPSNRIMLRLEGLFYEYSPRGGHGKFNKEFTEGKFVYQFDPPDFFEKFLSFKVFKNMNGELESGTIPFTLDRDKAIPYIIKQDINQRITIEGNEILFDSITVSPMSTVIMGKVNKTADLVNNEKEYSSIRFELVADGKKIESKGGGISDSDFEYEFDGINHVEKLELANIQIVKNEMIDKTFSLSEEKKNITLGTDKKAFTIKDFYISNDKTYLLIERNEDVNAVIGLFHEGKQIELLSRELRNKDPKTKLVEEYWIYDSNSLPEKLAVKTLDQSLRYDGTVSIPIK